MGDFIKLRITVFGDVASLDDLRGKHFATGHFNYNTIIPMPSDLNVETGSHLETGYAALYGDWTTVTGQWMFKEPAAALDFEWPLESRDQVLKSLEWLGCAEFYLAPARAFRANLDKYGFGDAFSWRAAQWGADCNGDLTPLAVALHKGALHLRVNVGSYPKIVMKKLSATYPALSFHIRYTTEYDRPGRSFILRNGREVEKHKLTVDALHNSVNEMPHTVPQVAQG